MNKKEKYNLSCYFKVMKFLQKVFIKMACSDAVSKDLNSILRVITTMIFLASFQIKSLHIGYIG